MSEILPHKKGVVSQNPENYKTISIFCLSYYHTTFPDFSNKISLFSPPEINWASGSGTKLHKSCMTSFMSTEMVIFLRILLPLDNAGNSLARKITMHFRTNRPIKLVFCRTNCSTKIVFLNTGWCYITIQYRLQF